MFYSAGDPTSGHGLVFGEVSISWSGFTAAGEILPTDLEEGMTPEIIAIVTVGIALAGVILASTRGVRQDMARLESRLDGRIDARLESRLDGRDRCTRVQDEHPAW